ncbi:MAG: hypothetical protein AAGL24_14480 [Pseudomonadota bacterium]
MLETNPALRAELAAIEAVQAEMAVGSPSEAERARGWEQLSAAIEADRTRVPANDNRRFTLRQVAAVAAIAVIGVQLLSYSVRTGGDYVGFTPASVTTEAPTLQIAFRQGARVDQIIALLRELDATIIDGPSATGLLTLQFGDAAARDTALATLIERTDVVDLVSQP